jgi:hypothetical protein
MLHHRPRDQSETRCSVPGVMYYGSSGESVMCGLLLLLI